jgi:predicted component of type VI protein secretion system
MEVKLRVLEGTNAGQEILLPVKKFFIGRAEECHLRPQSDLISRDHCAIVAEDAQAWVRDFGSKNGTFVNGERVRGEQPLKNGDRLRVGPLEFEVVLSTSVGGAKRPPVRDLKEAVARVAQSAPGGSLPVDQWLGDTTPAPPTGPEVQASRDTGNVASGDTGRLSDTSGGVRPAAEAPTPPAVSSATVPISASSLDTVALRAPLPTAPSPTAPPPAVSPVAAVPAAAPAVVSAAPAAPPAATPEEPKSTSSMYSRMAGAAAFAAPAAVPAVPLKPRQAPSVYVPPPPEVKVEGESAEKDGVPPPHTGKMPKSSTANSRDAAADTLRRLFGRR